MKALDKDFLPEVSEEDQEVLEEALARFKGLQEREGRSRALAIRDKVVIEAEGGAWEDSGIEYTSNNIEGSADDNAPEPPRYSIDRVTPVLEASLSDQRENQIQIQVRAANAPNKAVDDTMNGMIKNVEATSDADYAYDNGFDETQKCGYGGWQIVTEYAEDSFEQDIKICPIKDAASSLWFGPSDKYTKEDAPYAFVIWYEHITDFKAAYPNAQLVGIPDDNYSQWVNLDWYNSADGMLRLAAYWRKKPKKKEIVQLTNGDVVEVTEDFEKVLDELAAEGVRVETDSSGKEIRRKVDGYEIERYIITGAEVLKGPQKWLGKYIPLVPEYGVETTIQGKTLVRGRVRKTVDASQVYNYAISGAVKQSAISPQDLLMLTADQADGYETDIQNLNVSDAPAQLYNHIDGQPAPYRTQSRPIDNALIGIAQTMAENIAATVGGNVGTAIDGTAADSRSGEAILEGRIDGEKAGGIYMANHVRSVAYTGKILADLIPRIKNGSTQERIIKPDGSTEVVKINETVLDEESGDEVILNDLKQAKYDIVPDVGPAYATKRQQASAQIQSLAEKNPAFANRPDLIVKGVDLGDGGEMYESLRRELVLSGQVEPTEEERKEFNIDQIQMIEQQLYPKVLEKVMQDSQVRALNAQAAALESQAEATAQQPKINEIKAMGELIEKESKANAQTIKNITESFTAMRTQLEALGKQAELGIPMSLQDHDNLITQTEVVEDAQQEVHQGPNQEQLEDFNNVTQNME